MSTAMRYSMARRAASIGIHPETRDIPNLKEKASKKRDGRIDSILKEVIVHYSNAYLVPELEKGDHKSGEKI
jgi:hypothetical protein